MAEITSQHIRPVRAIGDVRAALDDVGVGQRRVLIRRRRRSSDGCVDLFGPETRFTGPNSQTKAASSGHSRCSTPTTRVAYLPANRGFSGSQTSLLKIVVSPVRFRVSPSFGVLGILADAGDVVLTVRFRVSPPPELAANRSFFAFCQGCAGGVFGPGNGEIGVYRTN
jgi:hypothetical protein